MLQVDNRTPFVAQLACFADEDGVDAVYPIIKATFIIGDRISLAPTQLPLILADEFYGDPGASSLKYASEIMPCKPATDVVMIGHAYAPGGGTATQVDVSLRIGDVEQVVRVFGDRFWKEGFMGNALSDPIPFEKVPLMWERTYGGTDTDPEGVATANEFNPVGCGFVTKKSKTSLAEIKVPNVENPQDLLSRPHNHPHPIGFAPICPTWKPRIEYAGTFDEEWQSNRAPILPINFDPHFYNVAPEGLIFEPFLTGGEKTVIRNATTDGLLEFSLPRLVFDISLRFPAGFIPVEVNLDTVCIEPDESRLTMIWRGKCQADKQLMKMEVARFCLNEQSEKVSGIPCE